MRIYLDNCCYNRPFDDQTQTSIAIETIAKLKIQESVKNGEYELVWSDVLEYENDNNPYDHKRNAIGLWRILASDFVKINNDILHYAENIGRMGIDEYDAMHIACAVASGCDYFITVDKKLLKRTLDEIEIISPITFIMLTEDD